MKRWVWGPGLLLAGITGVLMVALPGRWPILDMGIENQEARVTNYLDAIIAQSKTPGLQYVVVDSSGTLLDYAGGWADIRGGVPMRPTTTMMAYSMSKTITAATVLRLVASGQIGLDDPVQNYVGEVPYGTRVTIRRLLSHTAGVPSPIPLKWVHPASEHDGFDERSVLSAVLTEHDQVSSTPGKRYKYTNLGYWLLGAVVEDVTGEPFSASVESDILAPLGIGPRQLGYTIVDPDGHATGYLEKFSFMNLLKRFFLEDKYIDSYDGPWLRINTHYLNGPAFGGLVGTASGLGIFLQDQLQPVSRILPEEARALFYEQQQTTVGDTVPMTLGWHVGEMNGETYFFKEGGGGGFHSMMRLYPDRGLGSVMISNATAFDVARVLDQTDPQFFR